MPRQRQVEVVLGGRTSALVLPLPFPQVQQQLDHANGARVSDGAMFFTWTRDIFSIIHREPVAVLRHLIKVTNQQRVIRVRLS